MPAAASPLRTPPVQLLELEPKHLRHAHSLQGHVFLPPEHIALCLTVFPSSVASIFKALELEPKHLRRAHSLQDHVAKWLAPLVHPSAAAPHLAELLVARSGGSMVYITAILEILRRWVQAPKGDRISQGGERQIVEWML